MKSRFVLFAGAAWLVAGCASPAAAHENAIGLFAFDGSSGYAPNEGAIADRKGTLFGTTSIGGNGACDGGAGCGTVYALTPEKNHTWTFDVLYNFQGGQDGYAPNSLLTLGPQGSLYGYTAAGSYGTVYRLLPPAKGGTSWTFQRLYVFTGGADGNLFYVSSPLIRHGDALYGIASAGSSKCGQTGCGSVFRLAPPKSGNGSWTKTTLFDFTGGATGGQPTSIVGFGSGNAVYVSTQSGHGAVVQLAPNGDSWNETVLTTFKGGSDGSNPFNLVLAPDDTLYGLADRGDGGFAFELTPGNSGWTRTDIADIDYRHYGPNALAAGANGSLIGTVWGDVDFFAGAVFRLTRPANGGQWTDTELWNFNRGPDRNPLNAIPGRGGHVYGVLNGGDSGSGTIFELK